MDKCEFFWGSHGCSIEKGHKEKDKSSEHTCSCGHVWTLMWAPYGCDAELEGFKSENINE